MRKIENTIAISDVDPKNYDAVFLPGGHGTMFDLPNSQALADVVSAVFNADNVGGAVCHGPAGLLNAKDRNGEPIISGRNVGGFSDAEEAAVELTDAMPFLLETRLKELGGKYTSGGNWQSHAVRDENLITGQNPQSGEKAALLILEALQEK